MARSVARTRGGVEVVKRTGPDGKELVESFHAKLYEELHAASLVQLRVIAEEARELILDRLYNATPQRPGERRIRRPNALRRPEIMFAERRPAPLARLADRTVQDKVSAKQDGRKLIRTGDYTYGIEVRKGQRGNVVYYTIRPKPGKHADSELTHRVLAAMLEFGTSKMPKRPHWNPALLKTKQVLAEQGAYVRAVALRQAIRAVR